MTTSTYRLPAEWEPQSFVQLTWPHEETDWADYLDEAYRCYLNLAREILRYEDLLIVTQDPIGVQQQLLEAGISTSQETKHRVQIVSAPLNDTWARDHGFLTLLPTTEGNPLLCDFCFNGWGLKFAANHDNQINARLHQLWQGRAVDYSDLRRIVLEGGSVESDGAGTILTTSGCLLAPNRNGYETQAEAEAMLREALHAQRILWLDHGDLSGDDTDGHIDTLARLCPEETIVYVQCSDPTHPDYAGLKEMEGELQALHTADGHPYRLLPLPMAPRRYDEEGKLLPATYANFLILNGAVLMPTYREPQLDDAALDVLRAAFPGREVRGVDCSVLVRQHGSLHCVTMQYPAAVPL
jgi:agmatine/peptidylarginine deiminase